MFNLATEWAKKTEVLIYKDTKETKLGVTFYRCDPQEKGNPAAAIISRMTGMPDSAAYGKLLVGERILSVQGVEVESPLHAARLLRQSEGYLRISKLPKRDDYDANIEKYRLIEEENARKAMEATLPGQQPVSTPRTDAATPRGPGASGSMPLLTGLRVINGPGGGAPNAGLDLGKVGEDLTKNIGNLSARMGSFFSNVGSMLPTEENKRQKAAVKIQKSFRAYSSRGQFHEERGAVLMLQAASRRKKAQNVLKYKRTLVDWAALTIQHSWRRHSQEKKEKQRAAAAAAAAAAEAAAKKKGGVLGSLSRSLSFSKRNKGSGSTPRSNTPDVSSSGSEPSPTEASAAPAAAAPKKRSLSFTRRKKAAPDPTESAQNV